MSGGNKKKPEKERDSTQEYLDSCQERDPNFYKDMLMGKHLPGFNGFPIEHSYADRKLRDRNGKISGIFLIIAVLIVIIVSLIKNL
jgi:hypothetical protein